MWNHLPIASLVTMQKREKLMMMDEKIAELHAEGYSVEADRLLEERFEYAKHLDDHAYLGR